MRRLLAFLILLPCLAFGQSNTVNVTYCWTDFGLGIQSVRRATLTPLQPFADFNGALLTASPMSLVTGTNGCVTFTNLVSGYSYRIQLDTPYGSTVRTSGFPATLTGSVNGRDWLGDIQHQAFYYLYPSVTVSNITVGGGNATNVTLRSSASVNVTTNASGDWTPSVSAPVSNWVVAAATSIASTNIPAGVLTNTQSGVTLSGTNGTQFATFADLLDPYVPFYVNSITATNGFYGNGSGLTNVVTGNVTFYGYNTNILVLSGFGASFTTITNDHAGTYINGSVIDASSVNGSYYWNSTTKSYTNSSGYGVYYEATSTTATWLTNSTYPLTITGTAGSGISALGVAPPNYYQSAGLGGWLEGDLTTSYAGALSDFQVGGSGSLVSFLAFSNITSTAASLSTNINLPQLGQSNNYNGAFVGSLAGGTNLNAFSGLVPYSSTVSNMDNPTWLGWLASQYGAYSNWNRFGTSNTFWHVKNNQNFNVLFMGDGNVLDDLAVLFRSNCINMFGISGILSPPITYSGGPRAATLSPISMVSWPWPGVGVGDQDWVWYTPYNRLTNSTAAAIVQTAFPFNCDNFEVDYIQTTNGGPFQIRTNSGAGWGTVASLNGFAATEAGQAYRWTNAGGVISGTMQIMVTNTATGTNNWVAVGWMNSTVLGGVKFSVVADQSANVQMFEYVPKSVLSPIYKSWDPTVTLFYWNYITSLTPAIPPLFVNEVTFIHTNNPASDLVLCGEVINDYPYMPWHAIQLCRTNSPNYGYFDGMGMIGLTNLLSNARGLYSNDGGHMTETGYNAYSQLLWQWLSWPEKH